LASLHLPRWAEIVIVISQSQHKDCYYQRLLRNTDVAASYMREVLSELEKEGFLEVKSSGKIKRLVLTAAGNRLAFHLLESATLLGRRPVIRAYWG